MLAKTNANEDAEPEGKLCVTIDAYTGGRHLAPTNAVTRFKEAEAACATIAAAAVARDPTADVRRIDGQQQLGPALARDRAAVFGRMPGGVESGD
jgi:hypothetical protein